MDDGSPTLEVGFAIDTEGSFETLRQLQAAMDTTEARVVAEAAKIERATGNMISLGGATAQITSFGNAYTRTEQAISRDAAKIERAGERLVAQLERQNAAFGKTRAELRAMKVEELAVAAALANNTDLAARLRAQEAELYNQELAAARRAAQETEAAAEEKAMAAEREATAVREAAWAHQMFEARVREGAAAMRAEEAAAASDAVALQRLREMLDPAAAAQDRLTREMEEAQRVMLAAGHSAEEVARAQDLLAQRSTGAAARLAAEHDRLAAQVRASHAAQEADAVAAERLRAATDPLYAATKRLNEEIAESTRLYYAGATAPAEYARQQAVLIGRLREVEQAHDATARASGRAGSSLTQLTFQANDVITMWAMGAPVGQIFVSQIGQIVQVAQMAEGGVKGLAKEVGLLAVAYAPLLAVAAAAVGAFALFDRAVSKGVDTKELVNSLGLTQKEIKRLKDVSVDTGDVVGATFDVLAQRVGISVSDMSKWFGEALDFMTTIGRKALAALYSEFVGTFRVIGVIVRDVFAGKGIREILSDVGDTYRGAFNEADAAMTRFGEDVTKQIRSNKLDELRKQAKEIKADRTPNADNHAKQLAREAAATEAQIRNLYALAESYQVSGAAALIAEARVKAESQAIKQRADVEAAVERQIRLAIAQRVSDAEKGALATREQAQVQERVNAQVSAGLIPAERAADLVRGQIADLPLLAALQVSQQRGYAKEIEAAKRALDDQRKAREQLNRAEQEAQFNTSSAAGNERLAELREELRLIGETDAARIRALATLKAQQQASKWTYLSPEERADYIAQQVRIAELDLQRQLRADAFNDSLRYQADLLDAIATNVSIAANGMAEAFGKAGEALGGLASTFASYLADRERLDSSHEAELLKIRQIRDEQIRAQREQQENALFAARSLTSQVGLYGDMTSAAKGFFKEGSDGYKALETAEKAFRAVEFALSVRAIAQDAVETASSIAKSGARTATKAVEAVVSAISSLPFPLNLAAGAATIAALASIGVAVAGSFGGGKNNLPATNDGSGTVLGDTSAQSASIRNALDALTQIEDVTLSVNRDMLSSLRSIESNIGGLASLLVRTGNIDASAGVSEGFQSNLLGKVLSMGPFAAFGPVGVALSGLIKQIPIVGDVLGGISNLIGGLFGTKTRVVGSGLYGDDQSVGDILSSGFDASYYSDVQRKKRFLGLTTSTKYSTVYTGADPEIESQFTLLIRQFYEAIGQASGPLGQALGDVEQRLSNFTVNLGKIDLQGLTGEEIQEKLEAVFGAAADEMAKAGVPGLERFQQVGEGYFETLVRVASTVEAVDATFQLLGRTTGSLGVDIDMAISGLFDSVSDFVNASNAYFEAYYSDAEQAAARTAQMAKAFGSLGLVLPDTLAGFRSLVEAQDLTTAAGQQTYATLLQLAPAFADLKKSMDGAKSAADILSERQNLENQIRQLQGDTAAIRAAELAKLDVSNRALQEQVWAMQDAQKAAAAAEQLREAWTSVGDSIMDEVRRIRGLSDAGGGANFATLMGQFNAANAAARAGDMDAAKNLPQLSKSLLDAAALAATSRQELDRVRAQTAASLEATFAAISGLGGDVPSITGSSSDATLTSLAASAGSGTAAANDDLVGEIRALRAEVAQLRSENNSGHAAIAGNTGAIKRTLDNVTAASGGDAISIGVAA
ncbi:hypothetical protein CLG96_02135 [Sphingomonas oleivorans]|uniref:Bacteriophage tail tape measure N-terminal domain-containing protein n=1 Tax=Sphingomonas oleivorans TaxID=1735121 RepID=A0A2T5G1E0_9SPHN|nr:hypothetical protein [Sphingomonas oleivorans]PTQ12964.1 hypothetical protein CLG96_02135 [Sphingomonas oleivorans]